MRLRAMVALVAVASALAAAPAWAFVFRVGDTVYVDGRKYSWDEWKKIRDTYPRDTYSREAALEKPQPALAAGEPRAASCGTRGASEEFPADDERFECSAGLGLRTRDELLRQGWKIDLVEKIPAAGDARSPRGLPLFRYKLVISR